MATTPKAVEFSDDARRAYVPAPHHDSAPDAPVQGVLDDSFVVATDDAAADDTLTPASDGTPAKEGTTDEVDDEADDDIDDDDDDDDDDEDAVTDEE